MMGFFVRVGVGLAFLIGAIACAWLAISYEWRAERTFAFVAGAFFFICAAYASLFRPENWKHLRTWPFPSSEARFPFIQRHAFSLGLAVYAATVALFGLLILLLGPGRMEVAIGFSWPFLMLGFAFHVLWFLQVWRGHRQKQKE
ncbi:MAG: hypothetical protein JNJ73_05935 [Hyphomonadaceae bacterium]|nr:hypothetical protein [Hyphomonadaceae bacterium]